MARFTRVSLQEWLKGSWTAETLDILRLLKEAEIAGLGLVGESSNYTFLARLEHPDAGHGVGVYKPGRGEAPLYDFPSGTLYKREYASCLLSQLLGWPCIPPTVVRDGPQGVGTLQLFVPPRPGSYFFSLRSSQVSGLKAIATFDIIANNADRKGGHVFEDASGTLWSIDHGLTFHEYPKLRTVIWDYALEQVPGELLDDLRRLLHSLDSEGRSVDLLRPWLEVSELQALRARVEALLACPVFPEPTGRRSTPWPLV